MHESCTCLGIEVKACAHAPMSLGYLVRANPTFAPSLILIIILIIVILFICILLLSFIGLLIFIVPLILANRPYLHGPLHSQNH